MSAPHLLKQQSQPVNLADLGTVARLRSVYVHLITDGFSVKPEGTQNTPKKEEK